MAFDTGKTDFRLLGQLSYIIKTENLSFRQVLKMSPELITKNYTNSNGKEMHSYYIRNMSTEETLVTENYGDIKTAKSFSYNEIGLPSVVTSINSNGEVNTTETFYGFETYPSMLQKNILNQPIKTVSKIDNKVSNTQGIRWKEENSNVYPYQTLESMSSIRLIKEVTKIDSKGIVIEENNGKGISSVILTAYNYKYPVAGISNVTYDDVISALDVSYANLQTLSTDELKIELLKLYDKLSKDASISLTLYDNNGNVINNIDSRQEEVHYYYYAFNRLKYTTDKSGYRLQEKEYGYKK